MQGFVTQMLHACPSASSSFQNSITLVPDRRRDGTNVAARPCGVALPASYGGGSFRRHLELALDTGAPVTVLPHPHLAVDVDTIDDCRHPMIAPFVADVIGAHP